MDAAPTLPRSAGVLLHPSSLPGPFGVGDLGPAAHRWVDTLAAAGQTWWQILPLGPTGFGDSPYQAFSAFAGNVTLLSPELLERDGLVSASLWAGKSFPEGRADLAAATPFKEGLLRAAWDGFQAGKAPKLTEPFEQFVRREAGWLDGYALFTAVRASLCGAGLADWPAAVQRREPTAVAALQRELAGEVRRHQFGQFLFDRQWSALKSYANAKGIRVIGDLPIFVSGDSADVWANPDQFLLDEHGRPTAVAGVPPDYFSEDGQLWGNPLYDWGRMAETGYSWWVARVRQALRQVDLIRLDHFRGFRQAWHVPAGEPTAKSGRWVDGPGRTLFDRIGTEMGELPFVAEDLGLITPDVHALRKELGFPGMRVLQFAIGGPDNPYWPHNYDPNTVAYTGTHDNDTTAGWYAGLDDAARWTLGEYLGQAVTDPAADLLRVAWSSVAAVAIAPLQDVLGLGGDARMNKPGVAERNWRWRVRPEDFQPGMIERLAEITTRYNRTPAKAAG